MIVDRIADTKQLVPPGDAYQTVSFIIATVGRNSLIDTLASIETYPGDEVLVVQFPPPPHGWGGRERTAGIAAARGDYLAFIDDDDKYLPGARQVMHIAMVENIRRQPILFRMRYPSGRLVWDTPNLKCGNVGTPTIFVPDEKEKLPVWGDLHHSDFQFVNCFGWEERHLRWIDAVIVQLGHEDDRYWRKQKDAHKPVYPLP